jgi:hypothetical protein
VKVFVVFRDYGPEGREIDAIFSDRAAAEALEATSPWLFCIEEYELRSEYVPA